jgi:hypothetical protein
VLQNLLPVLRLQPELRRLDEDTAELFDGLRILVDERLHRRIAIAEIAQVLLGRDLPQVDPSRFHDGGIADSRRIGLDVTAQESGRGKAAVADRQEGVVLAFTHLQIREDRAGKADFRAIGRADADNGPFEIGRRLDRGFLGNDHPEDRLRKVIIDEDHINAAGAGGENRRRTGLPDLSLAGGHRLKDLRRAVHGLDLHIEPLLLEHLLADRDMKREVVHGRRVRQHHRYLRGRILRAGDAHRPRGKGKRYS